MKKHKTGTAIPFRVVELDKPRKLRLGMGTIVEFEQLTGEKIMEINENSSFDTLMRLLWVMFKREDPELTFEESLAIVDEYGGTLTDILGIIGEVISIAFGEREPQEEKPPELVVVEDKKK